MADPEQLFQSPAPRQIALPAILAAACGCACMGVLTILTEFSMAISHWLTFVKSAGDLSGVSSISLAAWIAVWVLLHRRWKRRPVSRPRLFLTAAFFLVLLGLAGTFPPLADWLSGK